MATIRLEAENFTLDGNLRVVGNSGFASNGAFIEVPLAQIGQTGIATTTFGGNTGTYDVVLHYFDENDGNASATVTIGGNSLPIVTFDQDLGGGSASPITLTSTVVAQNVTINNGDTIRIAALSDAAGEHARIDYLELISDDNNPGQANISGDLAINVPSGSTSVALTTSDLSALDFDNTTDALNYTVTTTPGQGSILVNGAAANTFTQAQLASGLVSYSFTGAGSTDSFVVAVDGKDTGNTPDDTATINVSIGDQTTPPVVINSFFSTELWARGSSLMGMGIPYAPVEVGGLNIGQLFDEAYYLNQNADVAAAVQRGDFSSGYQHFTMYGWLEVGRGPSVLFDEAYYLANNEDAAAAVGNSFSSAFQHFALYGHTEGRDPSELFDQSAYLDNNADVAAAVGTQFDSGFDHYIAYGAQEGRGPDVSLFQANYYLSQYTEVPGAIAQGLVVDAYDHFVRFGSAEGRNPSALFDESAYRNLHSDVNDAVLRGDVKSGFAHYVAFGRLEGREISTVA